MRDYNKIQFRSPSRKPKNTVGTPQKVLDQPLVPSNTNTKQNSNNIHRRNEEAEEEKLLTRASSTSTAATTAVTDNTAPTQQTSNQHANHQNNNHNYSNGMSSNHNNNHYLPPSNNKNNMARAPSPGAEATIQRLRNELDKNSAAAQQQQAAAVAVTPRDDDTAANNSAALAKSDATILELRSSVRQLKRQLEKVGEEKAAVEQEKVAAQNELRKQQQEDNGNNGDHLHHAEQQSEALDSRVGELQVQLDRAHAQILTADMVRKELEDTLEAEQYTWELRVQDQERTILQLQQECATLAEDLDQCRAQWKESEDSLSKEAHELQSKLEAAQQEIKHWKSMQRDTLEVGALKERLLTVEQQRTELQNCLDEALKELEAVDAELQRDGTGGVREENKRLQEMLSKQETQLVEPLQHLYQWLLERDGVEDSVQTSPRGSRELVAAIQSHLERMPANDKDVTAAKRQVAVLESQISVYKGDLKAREESSSELRASLKEAVSLLKPLQDAVAKADQEKARMQERIDRLQRGGAGVSGGQVKELRTALRNKEDEIERLQENVENLELQLSKAKLAAANNVLAAQRSPSSQTSSPDSITKVRKELAAKRAAENSLKKLLHDTQSRFNTLHKQNVEVEALNSELRDRLKDAEDTLDGTSTDSAAAMNTMQRSMDKRDAKLFELESETKVLRGELAKKDVELRKMTNELLQIRSDSGQIQLEHEQQDQVRELKSRLAATSKQLAQKKEVEKALNKSLKEALGLLKPLQMHLQEAEQEKRDMAKEMRTLRQNLNDSANAASRSISFNSNNPDAAAVKELETILRQLERENEQLHGALDEMSQSVNASNMSGMSNKGDSKLREDLVEMKSRYEVTKVRLDDAYVENKTLVEGLKKRDSEESDMVAELQVLRQKLKQSEVELDNAKYIATSALVKVEELTMAKVEQLSMNSYDQEEQLYREKAEVVEKEMKNARMHRSRVPYR